MLFAKFLPVGTSIGTCRCLYVPIYFSYRAELWLPALLPPCRHSARDDFSPCPDINPFGGTIPSNAGATSTRTRTVLYSNTVAAWGEVGTRYRNRTSRGRGVDEDWHYCTVLNYRSTRTV